jgi:hypothetical protein
MAESVGERPLIKPTTGNRGCCARAMNGLARAAPPRHEMKSRRLMASHPWRDNSSTSESTSHRSEMDCSSSVVGQTEKSGLATGKSALPSRTDIVSPAYQFRKVPQAASVSYSQELPRTLCYRNGRPMPQPVTATFAVVGTDFCTSSSAAYLLSYDISTVRTPRSRVAPCSPRAD